jgi:hypothetical protein
VLALAGLAGILLPNAATAQTGRWKWGGPTTCYWDPDDGGPDQCSPLEVEGDHFTGNGVPRFLLFVSYYDAMRRSNAGGTNTGDLDTDFQYLKDHGYDGIRILPNWLHYAQYGCGTHGAADDGLFTATGALREEQWPVFKRVLDRAAANGVLVDVTFTRETVTGTYSGVSVANYRAQIVEVARRLRITPGYDHVLFDLQNEYPDKELTLADIQSIATAVRDEDPSRLLTVSTGGGQAALAATTAVSAGLDLVATHTVRSASDWYTNETSADVTNAQAAMGSPHRPVYLQEPMPFSAFEGCTQAHDSTLTHHRTAAGTAKIAGAAAWTFHTRLTFDLASSSYVAKLAGAVDEQTELEAVRPHIASLPWGANVTPPPIPSSCIFSDDPLLAGASHPGRHPRRARRPTTTPTRSGRYGWLRTITTSFTPDSFGNVASDPGDGWPRTGRERGAPSGAEPRTVSMAFRRAPDGAVRGQDPSPQSIDNPLVAGRDRAVESIGVRPWGRRANVQRSACFE